MQLCDIVKVSLSKETVWRRCFNSLSYVIPSIANEFWNSCSNEHLHVATNEKHKFSLETEEQ